MNEDTVPLERLSVFTIKHCTVISRLTHILLFYRIFITFILCGLISVWHGGIRGVDGWDEIGVEHAGMN